MAVAKKAARKGISGIPPYKIPAGRKIARKIAKKVAKKAVAKKAAKKSA